MDHGCVYFEHKKHYAGRGYAYVAISRFRSRAGCHLYGVLRQSDFLPVGDDKEDEIWERGYDSLNSSDSEYEGHRHEGKGAEEDSESEYDIFDTVGNELKSVEPAKYSTAADADSAF